EVATVHGAQPDVAGGAGPGECGQELARRLDGGVHEADRAGEHVRRAAGGDSQRPARACEAVGGFVGRPLAPPRPHPPPPPPRATTTSTPSAAAPSAKRVACPRRLVSATWTSWSAASAFWMTTRALGVTDEAEVLTSSKRRIGESGSRREQSHAMNVAVCLK